MKPMLRGENCVANYIAVHELTQQAHNVETTLIQRWFNVNVKSTLFQRCVPAGVLIKTDSAIFDFCDIFVASKGLPYFSMFSQNLFTVNFRRHQNEVYTFCSFAINQPINPCTAEPRYVLFL